MLTLFSTGTLWGLVPYQVAIAREGRLRRSSGQLPADLRQVLYSYTGRRGKNDFFFKIPKAEGRCLMMIIVTWVTTSTETPMPCALSCFMVMLIVSPLLLGAPPAGVTYFRLATSSGTDVPPQVTPRWPPGDFVAGCRSCRMALLFNIARGYTELPVYRDEKPREAKSV